MRTTIRTGVALSVAGLATGGIVALTSAAPAQAAVVTYPGPICPYHVARWPKLNTWSLPKHRGGIVTGSVPYGYIVYARKCNNPTGWVKIRQKDPNWPIGGLHKDYVKRWWLSRF